MSVERDESVGMLFQGGHPHTAHKAFGDAVDAEYLHFETGDGPTRDATGEFVFQDKGSLSDRVRQGAVLPHFDVMIAEGTAPIQTLLVYASRHPNTTCLYLAADETFYTLPERRSELLWQTLRPAASRLLDGVVAVGQDVYEWATPYIGPQPVEIVHPPISEGKFGRLAAVEPHSPSSPFRLLSVGDGDAQAKKRFDRLVAAAEQLRADGIPVEVALLGSAHRSQGYATHEWVSTPGFVDLDEFADWFHRTSVYVQPSDGDSFPVATLEGMLSATPTVVTEGVGNRQLLPDSHVAPASVDGIAAAVRRQHDRSQAEREARAQDHRDAVTDITESNQRDRFASAVTTLATHD